MSKVVSLPTTSTNGTAAPTRREFVQTAALLGAGAALSGCANWTEEGFRAVPQYVLAQPENVVYSTCLQCHVACQIKAKIWDGTLAKLSGNPYSPQNYLPHLPYETDLATAAVTDGKLCAKGQSAIQTYYDPYRIRRVLKRDGPRGSNRWRSISFEQFVQEVVDGGRIFADIGEDRTYPGFAQVWALRDRDLARRMAADADRFRRGELSLEDFKRRWRDHLDVLIDPDHPDLGPRNNGFVFLAGRIEHGRKELMARFTKDSFGSVNYYEHTTICEQSHHIAFDELTGGATHHLKPDLMNSEFVLFWGTGAYTANFGLTPTAEKVTTGTVDRGMKTAVVDPRLSNDAGKADWWLPVKPGTDGALALAMARWIIENERYDERYLRAANKAAAAAAGETTWTNATHLVKVVPGEPQALLTAREAGIPGGDLPVVSRGGRLVAVDPDDERTPVVGDLFVDRSVRGIPVKSAFQLYADEAFARSFEEVEALTGVPYRLIAEVAHELTSHGKRAVVELYRGPVQHTDGVYAGAAVIALNLLVGNPDWKGGMQKGGGHWHESGGRAGSVYDFGSMHPSKAVTFGPHISRERTRYEDWSLFREEGYPARRPWYPLTNNVYQEVVPSFAQGYPYKGEILMLHKGTPALSTPAGHKLIEMLQDPERVPLFIACDIVIGETSMYADYILPDLTYLERWGTPHVTPDVLTKTSKVRQPVAPPLTEEVEVAGERMPLSLEAFFLAVADRLGLPGFGKDGFGSGLDFRRPEDWYLKLVANIAAGDEEGEVVPAATEEELRIFREARRHLPPSVFDEQKWRRAVRPQEWPHVVYVLNRGGRFADASTAYDGERVKARLGVMFHLFMEKVARTRNSMSGKPFEGVPVYRGQFDSFGEPLDAAGDYPLTLITFKEAFGGQSRTISNYWSNIGLQNENPIWVHTSDARRLGLKDGQRARVVSPTNPEGRVDLGDGRTIDVVGRVHVRESIRPGVVAVSWHYGHWAYGSNDVTVDGALVRGDRRRAAGLCPNPVMMIDPHLGDVCLTDPIGGSSSFFDTPVRLEPVST
ncbi:MAG: molybdopterin oxidoreductase [Gemmatimonadetes bacterium]|nr:MAG: molybdopterin oxidoreductase [Gemmatimonadota bacterium]